MGLSAGLEGCGKSRHTGIRSPDRPARSESLYQLRYPGLLLESGLFRTHGHSSNGIPTCLLTYRICYERAFAHLVHYRLSEVTRPATFSKITLKVQCKCMTSTSIRMSSTAVGF